VRIENISTSEQAITLYQGKSGFHYACMKGHTEIVNLLMARDDMDVNTKDNVSQQHWN